MTTRTIERICLVGLIDVAYRLFLRDVVRQHLGMETSATLAQLSPPVRRI